MSSFAYVLLIVENERISTMGELFLVIPELFFYDDEVVIIRLAMLTCLYQPQSHCMYLLKEFQVHTTNKYILFLLFLLCVTKAIRICYLYFYKYSFIPLE